MMLQQAAGEAAMECSCKRAGTLGDRLVHLALIKP